jgi:cytochrome c biogenesis protein CcmG, thiol:disulfide interchange protein DsbE
MPLSRRKNPFGRYPWTVRVLLGGLLLAPLSLSGCQSESQGDQAAVPEIRSGDSSGTEPSAAAARSPQAMPDFVLQDLTGKAVRLSDYAGKAVLLNFWATWCPPCKAELPDLVALQNEFGGERFTVLGVSLDQTGVDGVRDFVRDRGVNYPILMGNEDVVVKYGNFRGIPTTFLLNPSHELARKYSGLVTRDMVASELSKIFSEPA